LFSITETEFTEETAILTSESNEEGSSSACRSEI